MDGSFSDSPIPNTKKPRKILQNESVSNINTHTETKINEVEIDESDNIINIPKLSLNLNEINKEYIRQTEQIYIHQCPSLKYENAKQQSLWQLLSLQRINLNYPLLLYLIDCFLRDRLDYFNTKKNVLTIQTWCNKYKRIKSLLDEENNEQLKLKLENIIISGMETYLRRYCIPMILPTFHKINDSIERFTQCIQEINNLIFAIKKNPIAILPFQIDLLIIPQDVIDINNTCDSEESQAGSSDEFDTNDEESSEEESSLVEQKSQPENEIQSVDIKSRLKSNNILYTYNGDPNPTMKREFMKLYQKYQQLIHGNDTSSYYQSNGKHVTDLDNLGTDLQRFPHRRRLCFVVDRRLDTPVSNIVKEENEIYLFEPPVCNKIPTNHVKEWYMESTNQCVLPEEKLNDNNENESDDDIKCDHIKANTSMDGWINIFSFHIETAEDIKCYFYRDAQMLRFMPQDIVNLFPYLFKITNFKNDEFIQIEKDSKNNITKLKDIWKDVKFESFQKRVS